MSAGSACGAVPITIDDPLRTISFSIVASSTTPMSWSGTMTRSNVSSRSSRRSALKSPTCADLPKPNRWSTVVASASGPAAPATMTALRWVTRSTLRGPTTAWRRRDHRGIGFLEHLARRQQRIGSKTQDVARRRTIRVDDRRRDDHQQFGFERLPACAREKRPENRDVHQVRNTILDPLPLLVHEAGDDQALARPHVDGGLYAARSQRGNPEPSDEDRVRVVEAGHLGTHGQGDQAVVEDLWREPQTNAEFAIADRHERLTALT